MKFKKRKFRGIHMINGIKNKVRKLKNLLYFRIKQKTYRGECKINYLLEKNETSDKLIISFAALPNKNMPASYQYIRTLKNEKTNKLFILDNYGPTISGGSFYLAKNKNFKIERSVERLINKVSEDLNIKKEDIITIGSSKGGFAAVYYAMKYQYGTAIAGEPQVYLGNYLSGLDSMSLLNYIMGDHHTSESIDALNNIIINTIKYNNRKTKLYLLCAEGEHYHKNHLAPFIKELDYYNIWNSLELGQYSGHSKLGQYYPYYLLRILHNL